MTHHTDTERQAFEAVASDDGKWPQAIERDANGNYLLMQTASGWAWWQAARRAPAVPVPLRKPTIDQVAEAVGYHDSAWDCVDPSELIDAILMLAAAPHPPEAVQASVSNGTLEAPVELPEPEWWINYCAFTSKETASRIQESELASAPLYTEQQVRELLAAHGIGKDKA